MRAILKNPQDSYLLNQELEKRKIEVRFITDEETLEWVKDINTNPNSPTRHLKPSDRDLTLAELKEHIPYFTKEGTLFFDNVDEEESNQISYKLIAFFTEFKGYFQRLNEVHRLFYYIDYPNAEQVEEELKALDTYDEPEELPVEEQYVPTLEDGLMFAKDWSGHGFNLIFGNVDKPKFMKEKKYVDDSYNRLYRDSKGNGYMLMPLYRFDSKHITEAYQEAWSMGLREEFYFLMQYLYKIPPTFNEKTPNFKELVESLKSSYTAEELQARYNMLFEKLNLDLDYREVMYKRANKLSYYATYKGNKESLVVLNALLEAMK